MYRVVPDSDVGKTVEIAWRAHGAAQESNLPNDGLRRLTGFEDAEPNFYFAGERRRNKVTCAIPRARNCLHALTL